MELILNSNEQKINNNCLRYHFEQPIRFINQNISLTNMIFYIFFPNISDDFKLTVKYNNRDIEISFKEGAYNVDDISNIINLKIKQNSNIDIENPIKIVIDVNQYEILMIVKDEFKLILDQNFMRLLGFSKYIINPGCNRSNLSPQIDRTKYLKIIAI